MNGINNEVTKCCGEGHLCECGAEAIKHTNRGPRCSECAALTIKSAREILKPLDITLRKRDGEFRVNFKDGSEGPAYYTDDLSDALHTGVTMRGMSDAMQQHYFEEFERVAAEDAFLVCDICKRAGGGHAPSCDRLLENKEN